MEEQKIALISVSQELSDHFELVKTLRDNILVDNLAEARDKVAAINSMTSIIKDLSKMQQDVYNAERFSMLQQVVINTIKDKYPDLAQDVITTFEQLSL